MFRNRRSTFLWLRWLNIIALSYVMLFQEAGLVLSWPTGVIIALMVVSNVALMRAPAMIFELPWFDKALIVADVLAVTIAMVVTAFPSEHLLVFYFLVILMTTLARGAVATLVNGCVVIGIYVAVLFRQHGLGLLEHSQILLEIPFLLIGCISFSAFVHLERRRQQDIKKAADDKIGKLRAQVAWQDQELSGNEERLFQFLECVPVGIHVLDADGKTYYANEKAVDLLGPDIVASTETTRLPTVCRAFVAGSEEPYPAERMPITRALACESSTVTDMEVRSGETVIPLLVSASPIGAQGERAQFAIAAYQDISEQRRLELQFRETQKMEAIGRLAGGVAHDFNNLLTAIFSFGEFALENLQEDHTAHQDIQEVLKAAKSAENLTAQLLSFSRKRPVAPAVFCPSEAIVEIDRMLHRIIGDDIDFVSGRGKGAWNVRIDPGAFEQVLINLVVNACDAMKKGGKLTVGIENVDLQRAFAISSAVEMPVGQYVAIVVADTGAGMDDKTLGRVFDPFFTTKPVGQGTGLGLSTCFGIVKQSGGYISVRSKPGKGTSFHVYLPRSLQPRDMLQNEDQAPLVGGNETVLVVEDEEQVRALVVRTLRKYGYTVLEATMGEGALRVCEQSGKKIDLLLTDVSMPKMGGKVLSDRIADLQPGVRVVYMSGYAPDAMSQRGVLEKGPALLQKPFTPELLVGKVRDALDSSPTPALSAVLA